MATHATGSTSQAQRLTTADSRPWGRDPSDRCRRTHAPGSRQRTHPVGRRQARPTAPSQQPTRMVCAPTAHAHGSPQLTRLANKGRRVIIGAGARPPHRRAERIQLRPHCRKQGLPQSEYAVSASNTYAAVHRLTTRAYAWAIDAGLTRDCSAGVHWTGGRSHGCVCRPSGP